MSDPNPKAKAEELIGCVPILKPIAASHGLYVVAVCLAHGYKEPESLPCPLCERAAREEVQELERLCKSEIDLLNAMSIPWKHRDGPVNGVDGCACIACELHRVYQKELAALKLKLEAAKAVILSIPKCNIPAGTRLVWIDGGDWFQWMDRRNEALSQLNGSEEKK